MKSSSSSSINRTTTPSSPRVVVSNPYALAQHTNSQQHPGSSTPAPLIPPSAFSMEAMALELHRSQVALERLRAENRKFRERDENANAPLSGGILGWSDEKAIRVMSLSNMCNGAVFVTAAVGSFFIPGETTTTTLARIVLVAYMVVLGGLMMAMECNIATLQAPLREHFGWIFTYLGRSTFILL